MDTVDRRTLLATGALALAGAAAQGGRAEAQAGPKPIFASGRSRRTAVAST